MNLKAVLFFISVFALMTMAGFAFDDSTFQYGMKFGMVSNGFTAVPSSSANPFKEFTMDNQLGGIIGATYDVRVYKGTPNIFFSFSVNYKLIHCKGDFTTKDTTPMLGGFRNYFHALDTPLGVKVVYNKMNGRPFAGAGLQMDFLVAENHTTNKNDNPTMPEYNTVPAFNTRMNVGPYFNTGFEIPLSSYYLVFEFRYIHWQRDNFVPATSFYSRNKSEIQLTVGFKTR